MSDSVSLGLRNTKRGQLVYVTQWNNANLSPKEFIDSLLPSPRVNSYQLSSDVAHLTLSDDSDNDRMMKAQKFISSQTSNSDLLHSNQQQFEISPTKHDSSISNVISSPGQHYMDTELLIMNKCGDAKYKETLEHKLQHFARNDETLRTQSQQQWDSLQLILLRNKENSLKQLCALEQQHSEDARHKQNQLNKIHETIAKEQDTRLEKDLEKKRELLESLEDERRRRIVASLTCLYDIVSSCSSKLAELMRACRYPAQLGTSATASMEVMKQIEDRVSTMVASGQSGEITADDVSKVGQFTNEAKKIVESMEVHIVDANRRGDDMAASTAAAAASAAASTSTPSAVAARTIPVPSASTSSSPIGPPANESSPLLLPNVSDDVIKWYNSLQTSLEQTLTTCESFTKNQLYKKDRFNLQKAINTPINGISPSTTESVLDKLCRVLAGQVIDPGSNRQVCALSHEAGVLFCKQLLAKKLVNQGEEQVSSNHDSAFLFAKIAVGIWCQFPDFGDLLLAYFHQMCPYLVPYYFPLRDNQGSRQDYFRHLGYLIQENGEIEEHNKFLRRMSGFVRLYAAITCTQPPVSRRGPVAHPHGIQHTWQWLARIVNVEPRPDVTATTIGDVLSVAGFALHRAYGRQFVKIARLIADEYMPKIAAVTQAGAGGPVVRLEGLLRDAIAGRLPQKIASSTASNRST